MEYAVVIGIDHYKQKPLAGAVKDAKAFADWLVEKKLISNPVNNLKFMASEEVNDIASGMEIDRAIEEIIADARKQPQTEKNRLYFYFSGHGMGITFDNTALCLRSWPAWFHHCLSGADYKSWFINNGAFDEILIFLDCCRENDVTCKPKSPSPEWQYKMGDRVPDILICNSTLFGKLSYEISVDSNQKRGAFTSFLIDSLNGGAAPPSKSTITALDLKNHVNTHFESYAQRNNKDQKGDVYTIGQGGDNIVICEVQGLTEPYNYEFTFTRTTKIQLIYPDLKQVEKNVTTGQKWKVMLDRGLHLIKDLQTEEQKTIFNYSNETVSYEQF